MNPLVDTRAMISRVNGYPNSAGGGVAADFDLGVNARGSGSFGGNTNTRVAATLLAAGGVLLALRMAGWRFNMAISR